MWQYFGNEIFFFNFLEISIFETLIVSNSIFIIGLFGILINKRTIILLFMSIELMLLGISFNFILYSVFLSNTLGQIYSMLILTLAAAESAIGLALLVVFYRVKQTISLGFANELRG